MSRAQFLSYLRFSSADEAQGTPILNCTGDKDIDEDETLIHNVENGKASLSFAHKLSVGVCIFRLDEMTLRPTVLLLRRSPWWRRRRIFTSAVGRQGAGEWELPGGMVSDDDFCISAAIGRLVKEKTGLRVTKIMVMLSGVRWRAELKVLLWDENEGGLAYNDSTEEDDEDGVEDSLNEDHGQKVDSGVNLDWNNTSTMSTATTTVTIGDGEIGSTASIEDGKSRGEEEILALSDADVLGIRISTNSPSPRSPHVPVTPDSVPISPPPPPPQDGDLNDKPDEYDDGYAYQYGNDNDYKYVYDHDSDHDPSLEPAPLSLPSRTIAVVEEEKEGGKTLRRRDTASSTTLPASLLLLQGGVGCSKGRSRSRSKRRDAQVIPYKIVRKEYAQLNFAVLVDEDEDKGDGLPGFLYADSAGGSREKAGQGERKGVYEYDALEWATCAQVEKLPMSEDLRRVVLEGLAWIGELTAGFF